MEWLLALPGLGFLITVAAFVVVLGLVVFVHEYGHYIVARWCGIHADTFSMGFGPVIAAWTDRRGTVWQVAALPLGGFVKFKGDADPSSRMSPDALAAMTEDERAESFHTAAVWKRMATVAAGPIFNFLFAIAVLAVLVTLEGRPITPLTLAQVDPVPGQEMGVRAGDALLAVNGEPVEDIGQVAVVVGRMETPGPVTLTVRRDGETLEVEGAYPFTTRVLAVDPFKPAGRAGIETGDFILEANGQTLSAFSDLVTVVNAADLAEIELTILRDGERLTLTLAPEMADNQLGDGSFERRALIGVSGGIAYTAASESVWPWEAVWYGARAFLRLIERILQGMAALVQGVIGLENLQGPIGIAQAAGHVAQEGAFDFIHLIAVISTAIGIMNLLPVPVLDGGHLMFFAYEAATGRPPGDRFLRFAMSFGLAMVLLLMLFATYNDLMRLFV